MTAADEDRQKLCTAGSLTDDDLGRSPEEAWQFYRQRYRIKGRARRRRLDFMCGLFNGQRLMREAMTADTSVHVHAEEPTS